ncbi:11543_t:CDS:2, partial [Gigaspora rosea]
AALKIWPVSHVDKRYKGSFEPLLIALDDKIKGIPVHSFLRRQLAQELINIRPCYRGTGISNGIRLQHFPNGSPKKDLWTSTISRQQSSLDKLKQRNLSFK